MIIDTIKLCIIGICEANLPVFGGQQSLPNQGKSTFRTHCDIINVLACAKMLKSLKTLFDCNKTVLLSDFPTKETFQQEKLHTMAGILLWVLCKEFKPISSKFYVLMIKIFAFMSLIQNDDRTRSDHITVAS